MSAPVNGFSANSKDIKSFRMQQKLHGGVLVAAIAVPILGGIFAYKYYTRSTSPTLPTTVTTPSSLSTTSYTPPVVENAPGTTPAATTVPEGVTVALNSIEQNGMKSNPYVTADTSNIPAGTVVKADRSTWTAYGTDTGSVTTTMTVQGTAKKGSITFQLLYGSWKAVGYSIES